MTKKVQPIVIPKEVVFNAQKPKFNGFKCGHGVHGDTKYNRRKENAKWQKEVW